MQCYRFACFTQTASSVMADKDMIEGDVMSEKLPGAVLQICLFHTLCTFRREVTAEKVGIRSDEWLVCLEFMQKMAYASGEQAYEGLYHMAALKYFDSNWHGIKEQWVERLKLQQRSFLTRTNSRFESVNQKLRSVITKFSSIVTFFKDLRSVISTRSNLLYTGVHSTCIL